MIDFTKPLKTKSGASVRILCTDAKVLQTYNIVGLVTINDKEYVVYWNIEGQNEDCPLYDIENIPEEVITYKNVYADSGQSLEFSNLTECLKYVAKSYQPLFIVEMTKNKEGKVLEAKIVHYYV